MALGVYPITSYGASTGSSDNVAAFEAAREAAYAGGGGIVVVPAGDWELSTLYSGTGNKWHLDWHRSNVKLVGEGERSRLVTTQDAAFFNLGKLLSTTEVYTLAKATVYPLASTVLKYSSAITLDEESDAANFAVGDWIYIRTGQLVAADIYQPDAEINQVLGISGATLTLRWPTSKQYAQEYFITGTTGPSSVTPTANPALFGVSKATDLLTHNIEFSNIALYSPTVDRSHFLGGQLFNTRVHDCVMTSGRHCWFPSAHRRTRFYDNEIHLEAAEYRAYFATDTGCSDAVSERNYVTSKGVAFLHVHEGATKTKAVGDEIYSQPTSTSTDIPIHMAARARDTQILGCTVVNGGTNYALFIDSTCDGGLIDSNRFRGENFLYGMVNRGRNITIGPSNDIDPTKSLALQTALFGMAPTTVNTKKIEGWVADDAQTVTIGIIPAFSFVKPVIVQVVEQFNSDGTDLLDVGTDADNGLLLNDQDVSSLGVFEASTMYGRANAPVTVKARYVNGGSEPTTGKALIVIEYAPSEFAVD